MTDAPWAWLNRPGPAVMAQGLREDQRQQECADAYDQNVLAPACPACGAGVKDEDYDQHLAERHGVRCRALPYGKPDAREAVFVAESQIDLEIQLAAWYERHPGVRLAFLGEGKDPEGNCFWVRARQIDRCGRRAE